MKRLLLLVSAVVLFTGCGGAVPKAQYDAMSQQEKVSVYDAVTLNAMYGDNLKEDYAEYKKEIKKVAIIGVTTEYDIKSTTFVRTWDESFHTVEVTETKRFVISDEKLQKMQRSLYHEVENSLTKAGYAVIPHEDISKSKTLAEGTALGMLSSIDNALFRRHFTAYDGQDFTGVGASVIDTDDEFFNAVADELGVDVLVIVNVHQSWEFDDIGSTDGIDNFELDAQLRVKFSFVVPNKIMEDAGRGMQSGFFATNDPYTASYFTKYKAVYPVIYDGKDKAVVEKFLERRSQFDAVIDGEQKYNLEVVLEAFSRENF